MIKRLINIVTILLTIFSMMTVLQYFQIEQQKYPFHTNERLSITVTEKGKDKSSIITDINKLVDEHNVTFVKTTVDIKDYENRKDIIWFGSKKPEDNNPIITDKNIKWLGGKLNGTLITSNEIGERVLSGDYSYTYNEGFIDDLKAWANENNVRLEIEKKDSVLKIVYAQFILSGFGNGVLTSSILLITIFILFFVENAKARSIRLLGGISSSKIHVDDTWEITKSVICGEILGGMLTILYLFYKQGISLTGTLLIPFLLCLVSILISAIIISYSLSCIAAPKSKHLAEREIPLNKFNQLSKTIRIIAILSAFIILPSILQGLLITTNLLSEHSLWNENNSFVQIAFVDDEALLADEMLPETEKFFLDTYNANLSTISYVVDKAVQLDSKILGEYDHVIVTDKAWIDSVNIGVETSKENGNLLEVEYSNLDNPLREFLEAQLPLWTKTREVKPEGLGFYRFEGEIFIALPPGVGAGEKTIQAKNPLVILVDNPLKIFNVKGFLFPAATTGNLVFKDAEKLKEILDKSKVNLFVSSVDNIAEESLALAQRFAQQTLAYIVSAIVTFASIIFMSGLNGEIWAIQNKKRVFALHTFGESFSKIISSPIKKEIFITITTVLFGSLIAYFVHFIEWSMLMSVALIVILTQIISGLVIYRRCAIKAFTKAIHRG